MTAYDDYDANSTDNMPDDRSRKFMIVINGNATAAGAIIRVDAQIYALHQDHAEMIAETIVSELGLAGGVIDSVYELC